MPETQNSGAAFRNLWCKMLVNSNMMVWSATGHTELCEGQSSFKLTEAKWWNYLFFTVILPCAIIGYPLFEGEFVITKESGCDRMGFCSTWLPTAMCSGESWALHWGRASQNCRKKLQPSCSASPERPGKLNFSYEDIEKGGQHGACKDVHKKCLSRQKRGVCINTLTYFSGDWK